MKHVPQLADSDILEAESIDFQSIQVKIPRMLWRAMKHQAEDDTVPVSVVATALFARACRNYLAVRKAEAEVSSEQPAA